MSYISANADSNPIAAKEAQSSVQNMLRLIWQQLLNVSRLRKNQIENINVKEKEKEKEKREKEEKDKKEKEKKRS